jgi:transcriptional regulator with XRE-family HTH domain
MTDELDENRPGIGDRIKALRADRGLSQRDLAGDKLSPSYISLVEAGKRVPTRDVVDWIAERLGTSAAALLHQRPVKPDTDTEVQLELRWARIALKNGDADDAVTRVKKVLAVGPSTQAEKFDAQALLAVATEASGRVLEAIELLEEVSPHLDTERTQSEWIGAQASLCRCYKDIGDLNRAIDVGENAIQRVNGTVNEEIAMLAISLGGAYYERGDLQTASMVLDRVLKYAETVGSYRARGGALWNSSLVAAAENRLDDALTLAERALALFGESDNTRNLGRLRVAYAWLLLQSSVDDVPAIRRVLLHAQLDLEVEGSVVDVAACRTELAMCALLEGDFDEATRLAAKAQEALKDEPVVEAARAAVIIGQVMILTGRVSAGIDVLRGAAADLERASARREAARVWRELAELATYFDCEDIAREALASAVAVLGITPGSVRALLDRHGTKVRAVSCRG